MVDIRDIDSIMKKCYTPINTHPYCSVCPKVCMRVFACVSDLSKHYSLLCSLTLTAGSPTSRARPSPLCERLCVCVWESSRALRYMRNMYVSRTAWRLKRGPSDLFKGFSSNDPQTYWSKSFSPQLVRHQSTPSGSSQSLHFNRSQNVSHIQQTWRDFMNIWAAGVVSG